MSAPSIKRNVLANYAAQTYSTVVSILIAPLYFHYMGMEAYGLIGFFTMLTVWFQLLDVGLSSTLIRETARCRGGAIDLGTLRSFLRLLEVVFFGTGLVGAIVMVALSGEIATRWLNVQRLPVVEVVNAVMLIGLLVPLRWIAGLYRGVVAGFERQVWLGGYNTIIATLRSVGVIGVFALIGSTPTCFFLYQLVVGVTELAGLVVMTYLILGTGRHQRTRPSWRPLLGNLTFSLIIAFSTAAWVMMSQTDKLVLSKVLPLSDYGVFSMAIVAAGAVYTYGGVFGQALMPRMTKLAAEGDAAGVIQLYHNATQAICTFVAPIVVCLCVFGQPILYAWTGKQGLALQAAPILRLYAMGNGLATLCALTYYLQYARGNLRLHFVGQSAMVLLLIPLAVFAAIRGGAIGTGSVWTGLNLLYIVVWAPVIHTRFLDNQHWKWITRDVLSIIIPTAFAGWLMSVLIVWPPGRWATLAVAASAGIMLVVIAGGASSYVRSRAISIASKRILNFAQQRL